MRRVDSSLTTFPVPTLGPIKQRRIQVSRPSFQSLYLEFFFEGPEGRQLLSSATGFVCTCASGLVLVTNWHNVTGRNPVTGSHLSKTAAEPNLVEISIPTMQVGRLHKHSQRLRDADNHPLWIEHPKWGKDADMVAVELRGLANAQLVPYDTREDQDVIVRVGEVVSVVGFPFGLRVGGLAVWATGFVASEPEVDHDGRPVFLIDCRARQGQSGSAVIAHRNDVVQTATGTVMGRQATRLLGIYAGRINPESDLGRVWKTSAIDELLISIRARASAPK